MPETDSVEGSLFAARVLAGFLKVETVAEDITAALDGTGCYRRREAATQSAIQDYSPDWETSRFHRLCVGQCRRPAFLIAETGSRSSSRCWTPPTAS